MQGPQSPQTQNTLPDPPSPFSRWSSRHPPGAEAWARLCLPDPKPTPGTCPRGLKGSPDRKRAPGWGYFRARGCPPGRPGMRRRSLRHGRRGTRDRRAPSRCGRSGRHQRMSSRWTRRKCRTVAIPFWLRVKFHSVRTFRDICPEYESLGQIQTFQICNKANPGLRKEIKC